MRQLYAEAPHTFYIKIEDDLTWRELLCKIAISLGIKDLPYRREALQQHIMATFCSFRASFGKGLAAIWQLSMSLVFL